MIFDHVFSILTIAACLFGIVYAADGIVRARRKMRDMKKPSGIKSSSRPSPANMVR